MCGLEYLEPSRAPFHHISSPESYKALVQFRQAHFIVSPIIFTEGHQGHDGL